MKKHMFFIQGFLSCSILLAFFFLRCTESEVNRGNSFTFTDCDTLVCFAVNLIEMHDSVRMFEEDYSPRSFKFVEFQNDKRIEIDYSFFDEFHETIDTLALINHYGDHFIQNFPVSNYEPDNSGFCHGEYSFIDKDSIDRIKTYYQNEIIPEKRITYFTLSFPILSQSGDYLVVEMDKHSFGLSGEGLTFVFIKDKKDEWILDKKIVRWIS